MSDTQPRLLDDVHRWTPGTPATKFFRDAKGELRAQDVILNYSQPAHPYDAIADCQAGATVFVAREHAAQVAKELGVTYGA